MASNERQLNPAVLGELLEEMQRRLEKMGVSGSITIGCGAALALTYPNDENVRATTNVDALYAPSDEVDTVAREIADERGLNPHWLNSDAKPWLSAAISRPVVIDGTFRIGVADPWQLIALKLAAGREQDLSDLKVLVKHEGICTADDIVNIAYEIFGEESVELSDGRESYLLTRKLFPNRFGPTMRAPQADSNTLGSADPTMRHFARSRSVGRDCLASSTRAKSAFG